MTDDPFAAPPRRDGMRPAEPMGSDASFVPTRPTFEPEPIAADAPPPVPGPMPPAPPPPPHQAAPAPRQATPAYAPYPPAVNPYPKTWMNIVALVTSLVGLGLGGIIFGHLGVAAANRGEAQYKGLGIAGLVIGYFEFLAVILAIAIPIILLSTSSTIQ